MKRKVISAPQIHIHNNSKRIWKIISYFFVAKCIMDYIELGMVDVSLLSTVAQFCSSWCQIPTFFVQTLKLFFCNRK